MATLKAVFLFLVIMGTDGKHYGEAFPFVDEKNCQAAGMALGPELLKRPEVANVAMLCMPIELPNKKGNPA